MEQFEIVAVKRSGNGNLTNFKLNNGQELNYEETLQMVQEEKIKGVDIVSRKDKKIIRSNPDGVEGNNFGNLPTF